MLRTAFIGAGPRSQNAHYPNVNRLPEVEMVAACELDEARLHEVAVAYDFQYRYDDHRRMLDEVDPGPCLLRNARALAAAAGAGLSERGQEHIYREAAGDEHG